MIYCKPAQLPGWAGLFYNGFGNFMSHVVGEDDLEIRFLGVWVAEFVAVYSKFIFVFV